MKLTFFKRNKLSLFFGFAIAVFAFLFFIFQENFFKVSVLNNYSSLETKEYRLTPQKNLFFFNKFVFYPEAKVSPSSTGYYLLALKEGEEIKEGFHDQLYFASKRMTELHVFGKDLPILRNFKSVDDFKKWWREKQPTLFNSSGFGSWEAGLARYLNLLEEDISLTEKKPNISQEDWLEIYNNVKQHHDNLRSLILTLPKTEEEKKYLSAVAQEISNFLFFRLKNYLISPEPSQPEYLLSQIIEEKNWGRYKVWVDLSDIPEKFKEPLTLRFGQKILTLEKKNDKSAFDSFGVIGVENNKSLSLEFPKSNLLKDLIVVPKEIGPVPVGLIDQKTGKEETVEKILYQYTLPLSNISVSDKYFVYGSLILEAPLMVRVEEDYFDESDKTQKKAVLVNDTLQPLSDKKSVSYLQSIFLPKEFALNGSLTLVSLVPLSQQAVNQLEITPEFYPDIYLEKIGEDKNVVVGGLEKNKFKPWFLFPLLGGVLVFYWTRKPSNLREIIIQRGKKSFLVTIYTIKKYFRKLRYLFAIFFVLGFLTDIFLIGIHFETFSFLVLLLFLGTKVAFGLESKIPFLMVLSLLPIFIISLILNGPITEKTALWIFFLISVGILQPAKASQS